ncbi:MAG: endolytic transglycosylase MltG, partial [Proteobacteria bacterium]|nr:endolytic transglycosylase MltG [Pseudomonadota bacterium]
MSGSKAIAKKTLVVSVVIGVLLFAAKFSYSVNQEIPLSEGNTTFVIKKGDTFNSVIERISRELGTSNVFWTKLVYKIHGTPIVKAGRYNIYPETRLNQLIKRFSDGDIERFRFTIIEGTIASRAEFKLKDIIELNNLDISIDEEIKAFFSKEAMIFPDTYFFSDSDDLKRVLQTSKESLHEYLQDLWQQKPNSNPLKTPEEALVLASMIEREAMLTSEQQTIASVFLFRLVKGMRLQSDPTSSYGYYQDYGEKIGRKVLVDQNEFNTYKIDGLPP